MPSSWKKSGGFHRLISGLRSNRAAAVDLVVETGFPTSLADLVVKNHSRLKGPSHKKNKIPSTSPSPSPQRLPPPSPAPAAAAASPRRPSPVRPKNLGLGFLVSEMLALALLAVGEKQLVFRITIAAFALMILDLLGFRVFEILTPCADARRRMNSAVGGVELEGTQPVSPVREIAAVSRSDSLKNREVSSEGSAVSDISSEDSIISVVVQKRSQKKPSPNMTNPDGSDVGVTGALSLFAVVFNDGDRVIPLPRSVVVFSKADFKEFKEMISQKIGGEPHQIATFLIHRRKGRSSPGRKIPTNESTDFAALVRNSQDCHILAVLRKSPRRDRRPRRGIPRIPDSPREQELWENHLLDRIRQLEIQEHELKLPEQELHMRMQMEQQYMMANFSYPSVPVAQPRYVKRNSDVRVACWLSHDMSKGKEKLPVSLFNDIDDGSKDVGCGCVSNTGDHKPSVILGRNGDNSALEKSGFTKMDSPISRIVSVSASPYGPTWRDLDAASSANAGKGGSDGGALDFVPLFIRQFVAGGIAKSAVAPLERVKILFQTRRAEFQSVGIWGSFRKITQTEGLSGFYRGNGASVARIVPYAALHYMVYEQYREWIMYGFPDIGKGPVLDLLAGAFAGGTAVISTYPLDLVRTKLAFQVVGSSKSEQVYGGIADCFSKIYKQNGFRGLYRGVGPTMYGIFPYSGLRFFVYETLKISFEEERKKHISVNLACGSVAGLVGQTVTYPLDVVRRQMQVHAFSTSNHVIEKGTFETLAMIIRTQGWRSLFSGLSINYVKVVPSVAIGFTVYEEMKSLLKVPSRRGEANARVKKETSNKPPSSLDSDSE